MPDGTELYTSPPSPKAETEAEAVKALGEMITALREAQERIDSNKRARSDTCEPLNLAAAAEDALGVITELARCWYNGIAPKRESDAIEPT